MPRRSLEASQRRSAHLRVRLTLAEEARLHELANRSGMSFADFTRRRVLDGKVTVQRTRRLAPEALAEVRKIGINVNQIARRMNQEVRVWPGQVQEVRGQLARLLELLESAGHEPGDQ